MTTEEKKRKTTAAKTTDTGSEAYKFTKLMYSRATEAIQEGKPVIWIKGSGAQQIELLAAAFDVAAVYPENYAAACAAKQAAAPFIDYSEADGFSNLICSYAKCGLGYARRLGELGAVPPEAPLRGMPKPALMIVNKVVCDAGYKWFQSVARYLEVPCCGVDGPLMQVGEDWEEKWKYVIDYVAQELRDLAAVLEKVTGQKLNIDKLSQLVAISDKVREVWHNCDELRKAVPCPMAGEDYWSAMVPGYWLPGEEITLDFYNRLYSELKERVDSKIGAIPNEKYRLFWWWLPPWHTMELLNYLEELGALIVFESPAYHPDRPPPIPESETDPFRRLAWRQPWVWGTPYLAEKARVEAQRWTTQWALEKVRDYRCDGAICYTLITCRSVSVGQKHARDAFLRFAKVPSLMLEGDHVDIRLASEAEFKNQVETFLEVMDSYKRIRQAEGLPVAHPV